MKSGVVAFLVGGRRGIQVVRAGEWWQGMQFRTRTVTIRSLNGGIQFPIRRADRWSIDSVGIGRRDRARALAGLHGSNVEKTRWWNSCIGRDPLGIRSHELLRFAWVLCSVAVEKECEC